MLKPLLGCLIGLSACLFAGASSAQEAALAIEARLFGSATGQLSADVLAPGGPALGNVVMGDQASTSTFVVVRITSNPPVRLGARIRLVAVANERRGASQKTRRRMVLDSAVIVPPAAASGNPTYVGFWLADTGCAPIALKAVLSAPETPTVSKEATLDFTCNE